MKLGMRIRVARHHARLSQAELAARVGVGRSAVANWECDDGVHPVAVRLERIALTTSVSYEWLATGRGRMSYQAGPEDIPAVQGEVVDDAEERRLLKAFRACSPKHRALLLEMAELHVGRARVRRRVD
ncbi:helix-turn-helix domain-containing protein [Pseudoxanthomonas mexicana]|uniref:helix-turn-helix domain-containing protein n=1 Tax=Pseudoxanthomonas mexicana TaxID=128785 RepID=UPI00398A7A0B